MSSKQYQKVFKCKWFDLPRSLVTASEILCWPKFKDVWSRLQNNYYSRQALSQNTMKVGLLNGDTNDTTLGCV